MTVHLSVTEWGDSAQPTVVLLHGILGSSAYWRGVARLLPDRRVVALDLLGFGRSPRPAAAAYDYADHCAAIVQTLGSLGIRGPVVLAGHSMGALIALRLAAEDPRLAEALCLFGMPVFTSPAEARAAIGRTWLRRTLLYGPVSRMFCLLWCQALRPVSRRLAPWYLRMVPAAVAGATVDHSWRSYARSLANIVERQEAVADLARVSCPTVLVRGEADVDAALPQGARLPAWVSVLELPGHHQLPVERPAEVARLIRDVRPGVAAGQRRR